MKAMLFSFFLMLTLTSARAEFLPQGFSAKFEQEYTSVLKGKQKKGEGSIDYKYPGNIRFETSSPSQVIFVSNGSKSWYYRAPFIEGEEGEVTISETKDGGNLYTKFFDSLKKGLESNDLYDVKNSSAGVFTVAFKPKTAKEIGIKEANLTFISDKNKNFSELKKIDLLFPDGKKSSLKLIDLKINPAFDDKKFNFEIPPKTRRTS